MFGIVFQDSGGHHRRQSERDECGEHDGDGQRHREFAEQTAHDIRHEQQRNQHGNQRNRQRNDGEADFAGSLERRRHRRLAHFEIARDVLDHHDGVVDDEAGRDGERHQREIVEAVTQHVHHGEGADQRQAEPRFRE